MKTQGKQSRDTNNDKAEAKELFPILGFRARNASRWGLFFFHYAVCEWASAQEREYMRMQAIEILGWNFGSLINTVV